MVHHKNMIAYSTQDNIVEINLTDEMDRREKLPKLKTPYYQEEKGNMGYFPFTQAEKLVANYMRYSFAQVQ